MDMFDFLLVLICEEVWGRLIFPLLLCQVKEMENKLAKLRGGVTLVKPEDRMAVEEMFLEKLSQWRKRKRMLRDIWDPIMENSPKNLKEFKVLSVVCLVKQNCLLLQNLFTVVDFVFHRKNLELNMMKMLV